MSQVLVLEVRNGTGTPKKSFINQDLQSDLLRSQNEVTWTLERPLRDAKEITLKVLEYGAPYKPGATWGLHHLLSETTLLSTVDKRIKMYYIFLRKACNLTIINCYWSWEIPLPK